MSEFFAWFEKSRRKSSDRSWRGRRRLLLALEILEPRQMLAADGLGGFVPSLPPEQVCAQVCDGVVLVPYWNQEQGACSDESLGVSDRDGATQIYLDEIAEEIGELYEIEDQEDWWLDAE
jgi:hypothetical protein